MAAEHLAPDVLQHVARLHHQRQENDENDDELTYDVLYRREGETEWTPLRRALDEPILVWDTTVVPNGTYFVRVIASDRPSNPAASALTGERDSVAIQIDHTPPVIVVGSVRADGAKATLVFDVKDADSPVARFKTPRARFALMLQ